MKVAVIGAGIVGLSAARFLSKRGHRVEVFEQFPLFHDRGSSHGRTRIVRRAYPSVFWTGIMIEAYPLWRELELECSESLITECGLIYFGRQDAPRMQSGIRALEELGVPHKVLTPREAYLTLPGLQLGNEEVGILTPEAGFVRADLALRATYRLAESQGTIFHQAKADPHHLIREFDLVIVGAGSWIRQLIPDLDVLVTRQTFAYEQMPVGGPVWIDDTTLAYGFPSDEMGRKIGAHHLGPEANPDDPGVPSVDHLRQIKETLRQRFGITTPALEGVTTCLYTSTSDEMFRMGWLADNVLFASACSGHGFKLGPWVGRTLAGIAEGEDIPKAFRS